ncbi:MAG: outer membrane lipoprotein-sorting protein [Polyangia bacterium]|jgi:hypothetical protein|nr:outer membrane lipoprotein-sorting protein [Polyangia bacterium]
MHTALLSALVSLTFSGQADSLTAKQIVDKALDHTYLGSDGSEAQVTMILTSSRGTQRERRLMVWSQRLGKRVRSLVRIVSPPDVAGTSFLLTERAGGGDDMHLYIPALKRARRLVGRARRGQFLGSDFTYADLETKELRDASHRRLPDEKIGRFPCHVIEAKPRPGADSQYGKVVAFVRKDNFVTIRLEMYDDKGALQKQLFVRRLGRTGTRTVIKESRMVNKREGSSTLLRLDSTRSLTSRPDEIFTVRNLARGL